MKTNKLKTGFFSLTLFSLFEKVVAFVYQAATAAFLGAGMLTDCYVSASQLFDLVDSTILSALVVVTIHKYNQVCHDEGEEKGLSLLSNVSACFSLLMVAISVLVLIFANPLSYVIAPGFSGESRKQLIFSIRILSCVPAIMSLASVRQAFLRHHRRFLAVNSRSLCISLCGMASLAVMYVIKPSTPFFLCLGYIVSNLLFVALLMVCSRKFGKIAFVRPRIDNNVIGLIKMAIPTIISSGIVRLTLMADQIIASSSPKGSVSCLNYSQQLYHIVTGLLIVNLSMILLTDFVKLAVSNSFDKILLRIRKAISSILLLLLPVTIMTIVYSNEIVQIAFERGEFGRESTLQVATLLLCYALGFIPMLFNNIYTQLLYAFGKTKTAMYISSISLVVNLVASLALVRVIGLAGIALGTSISQLVVILFNRMAVKKCIPTYKSALSLKFVCKLLASAAAGAIAVLLFKMVSLSALFSFALATVLFFLVFFACMLLLREETTKDYFNIALSFLKKKLHV